MFLKDFIIFHDSLRKPVISSKRKFGIYPYYGAQGIVDFVDDFIFDGKFVLLAEDGNNLSLQNEDISRIAHGKFWVNNHAHVLTTNKDMILEYLNYFLNSIDITPYITGSAQPKLNKENVSKIKIEPHSYEEQQHIVNILGSIDDKIENNEKKILNIKKLIMNLYEKISLNKPYVKIGNFTTEIKERLNSRTSKAYSVINSGELVEQDSYFVRQMHSNDMYKYKVIRKYDFAYNPSRINIGSIAMFQHEFGAVSPIYIAFTCDKKYSYYINEFTKTSQFNKEICLRANGSVRQTVSYDSFIEIQIPLPDENDLIKYNNVYFKLQEIVVALKSENIKLNELKKLYLKKFFS